MPEVQVPAWTVGQAVAMYRAWCIALSSTQYYINAISPPTLTTHLGYRAIEFEVTSYEIITTVRIVVLSLPASATLPMRYATADPGWNGTLKGTYQVPADEGLDWGFLQAAWALRVPELKKLIAVAWCGATVAHEHTETVLTETLQEGVSLWTATFATGTSFFPSWEMLLCFNHPASGPVWVDQSVPPAFEAGSVSLSAPIDTSGIVKALNSIAMMDTDISFNNGQAVYSVRGRSST